jgi:hypothetical protein
MPEACAAPAAAEPPLCCALADAARSAATAKIAAPGRKTDRQDRFLSVMSLHEKPAGACSGEKQAPYIEDIDSRCVRVKRRRLVPYTMKMLKNAAIGFASALNRCHDGLSLNFADARNLFFVCCA